MNSPIARSPSRAKWAVPSTSRCRSWTGTCSSAQRVLGEPIWLERMGANERRGMTPLFSGHVNPYGTFHLDMTARLPSIRLSRRVSQASYRCMASDDPGRPLLCAR